VTYILKGTPQLGISLGARITFTVQLCNNQYHVYEDIISSNVGMQTGGLV